MKTKQTAIIDINKLKQNAVHTGLLEVMLLLKDARDRLNSILDEDNVKEYSSVFEKLDEVSSGVCAYECNIGEVIGMFFTERAESYISKISKQQNPINDYINKRYDRWLDYATYHCTQQNMEDEAVDVLNEVLESVLKKNEAEIERLFQEKKDKYTDLDFYILRLIRMNIEISKEITD